MIGNKYAETKSLSTTEIAKLVRKDLKATFPGLKFSVTTAYFSGGSSIAIELKTKPEGFQIYTSSPLDTVRYTQEAIMFMRSVEQVANAYSFDHSDTMTDYFHVRFYTHVRIDRIRWDTGFLAETKVRMGQRIGEKVSR